MLAVLKRDLFLVKEHLGIFKAAKRIGNPTAYAELSHPLLRPVNGRSRVRSSRIGP